VIIVIIEHAVLGSFDIIEFTIFDRPDEHQPDTGADEQAENNQNKSGLQHVANRFTESVGAAYCGPNAANCSPRRRN
jgi:hypothetical protein